MFCTNCGKKLHDGDKFCAHCGVKVRVEAPEPAVTPARQEVVFNPPFKVEAERRTSEIFRGFASETPEEKKPRHTEPANFDWNLDGFPKETRKTEDIDFNWDSVIERRNQQRREEQHQNASAPAPVVDKIDIRGAAEKAEPQRVRTPLFAEPEVKQPESEVKQPEPEVKWIESEVKQPEPAEVPELKLPAEEEKTEEPAMSIEELEEELFGTDYKGIGEMAPEENIESTAQLEKFYTYNQKNEEFQELLDKEYERLKGMEDARRADTESLEFTWAKTLFPERKEAEPTVPEMVEAELSDMEIRETELEEKPAETVPATTIDFSAVREEARQKKQQGEKPAEEENGPSVAAETAAEEVTDDEVPSEAQAVSEPEAESEAAKPAEEPAAEPAAKEPAEEVPADEAETAEPELSGLETAEPEAETPSRGESEDREDGADEHDEKAKLRYSDIFPRENSDGDRHDGSSAAAAGVAKVFNEIEEDDEDEPKKMNFFVKLIIFILALLIIAEGIILLAKFIAPDSAFSQKADEVIENIMDLVTGGEGNAGSDDGDTDGEPVSGNLNKATYISEIIEEKIEVPDSIGEVLEDAALTYALVEKPAFEEVKDAAEFENGDWKTEDGEEPVTYAEGILNAIVGYYGQWQATNRDTSLIGINKLEIGEILTGEKGYYALCRLTFAGTDGEEVVKYVTACVKISQNSMLLNEIKEEKL